MSLQSILKITCVLVTMCFSMLADAQIPPPGHEEYLKRAEELRQMSILDRDSIVILDTTAIYDPTTFEEELTITRNKWSLRYYYKEILGIQDPDALLSGEIMEITNPDTYEKMQVRWNARESKIDTLH